MTITRPDLSYAVGVVSQFMQTPQKPHLDAVRRILRYIKHTLQYGIFYEAKSKLQVHALLKILSFTTNCYVIGLQLVVVCNYLDHVCNYKFGIVKNFNCTIVCATKCVQHGHIL
jgi:hypothetical protein